MLLNEPYAGLDVEARVVVDELLAVGKRGVSRELYRWRGPLGVCQHRMVNPRRRPARKSISAIRAESALYG